MEQAGPVEPSEPRLAIGSVRLAVAGLLPSLEWPALLMVPALLQMPQVLQRPEVSVVQEDPELLEGLVELADLMRTMQQSLKLAGQQPHHSVHSVLPGQVRQILVPVLLVAGLARAWSSIQHRCYQD